MADASSQNSGDDGRSSGIPAKDDAKSASKQRIKVAVANVNLRNAHRGLLQAFGAVVSVLLNSKLHRGHPIASLEATIVPALATGQFAIAEATIKDSQISKPIAFVLWGTFSETVDAKLQESGSNAFPTSPAEWRGGSIVWIAEAVGPGRQVSELIEQQMKTTWKAKTVRLRTVDANGNLSVKTF